MNNQNQVLAKHVIYNAWTTKLAKRMAKKIGTLTGLENLICVVNEYSVVIGLKSPEGAKKPKNIFGITDGSEVSVSVSTPSNGVRFAYIHRKDVEREMAEAIAKNENAISSIVCSFCKQYRNKLSKM